MLRKISEEVEVKTSISKAWDVYSTLKICMIIKSECAHIFGIDILEGDGGVGTIIKVTPRPGMSNVTPYKEIVIMIDNEKKVKEVEIIGGYLEMGLTSYRIIFVLTGNQKENLCIVRVTIEYEANEDVIAKTDASVFLIKPLMDVLDVVNEYIQNNMT